MGDDPCPTCGTTAMTFDPPLEFTVGKMCGAVKPGTYAATATNRPPIPVCNAPIGHDGKHYSLIEYLDQW